jgi:hypothetical protein
MAAACRRRDHGNGGFAFGPTCRKRCPDIDDPAKL